MQTTDQTSDTRRSESPSTFERQLVRDQTERAIELTLTQVDSAIRSYGIFNLLFIGLLVLEITLFALFFTLLLQASVVAISLSAMVLTLFTYFTLRIYFQTRKPLLFDRITKDYLRSCQELLSYIPGIPEHHLILANACMRAASALQGREHTYYRPPGWLDVARPYVQRISCWWHWEDVLAVREQLLFMAIDEHLALVKLEPTSLEGHTALANSYVTLSSLYMDPRKSTGDDIWSPSEDALKDLQRRFRIAAERAIEEFKILNAYAPNDPWIHTQLAYSYHDLQMPEEEIKEYEAILKLRPDDNDTLFKLGRLYFQQGFNAKGLRVYESLCQRESSAAEELIAYYGDYKPYG